MIPTARHIQYALGFIELGLLDEASDELEAIAFEDRLSTEVVAARVELHLAAKHWDVTANFARTLAKTLLNQMTTEWEPERYQDEYAEAVTKLIEAKVKARGKEVVAKKGRAASATNVIDLAQVLQDSLAAAGKGKPSTKAKKKQHTKAA